MLLWLYPRDPLILLLPPLRHLHLHPLVTPPVHLHLLGQNRHSIAERAEVNAAISCKAPFAIIHVTLSESYENMLSSLQHSYSLSNFTGRILSVSQSWLTTLANSDLNFLYSQSKKLKDSGFCDRGWHFTQTYNKLVKKREDSGYRWTILDWGQYQLCSRQSHIKLWTFYLKQRH